MSIIIPSLEMKLKHRDDNLLKVAQLIKMEPGSRMWVIS